jgi:release factor glutamine methyltransferase
MDSYWVNWAEKLLVVDEKPLRLMGWLLRESGIETDVRFLNVNDLSFAQQSMIENAFQRLLAREPLSKILGEKEFYGRMFKTTRDTLDPREDSETLIECVKLYQQPNDAFTILDLGTGTGCLIVTLLALFPEAIGIALDKCPKALNVAMENAKRHHVQHRVGFLESDWCRALVSSSLCEQFQSKQVKGTFDVILSNPPYIRDDYALAPSVAYYDPAAALFGGKDGLDAYRSLFKELPSFCHATTKICMEIGYDQFQSVPFIAESYGFQLIDTRRDANGHCRSLVFQHIGT